ncbi:MAG: hypothetical protein GWP61_24245 [Chloroflexi bacterium]|jgi:hypothetical protein|nr:hypothetical protein [Chloroflexota bacterium]
MGKFVLVYTGGGMPETEEEQAAVMAAWGAWYQGLGEAVADPGNPFSPAVKNITSDRNVSDGAIGTASSGYTILNADSMEAAIGMAKNCPMLDGNGQITVYETFEM